MAKKEGDGAKSKKRKADGGFIYLFLVGLGLRTGTLIWDGVLEPKLPKEPKAKKKKEKPAKTEKPKGNYCLLYHHDIIEN